MSTAGVIEAVKRQFGDETGAMIEESDIFRWINEGQFQIARKIGDVVNSTTIPVVVGDYRYNLPADFFKVIHVELDGTKLQWTTPSTMRSLFPSLESSGAQAGAAKFFSIQSTGTVNIAELLLAPIPAVAASLAISYQRRPPIIVTAADPLTIPEEYESTLITFCLAKAKQLDGDDEAFIAMTAAFKAEVHDDAHDSRHKDDDTYPVIRPSLGDVGWGDIY